VNKLNNKISVLFVCTANICRSPTAEAVFRHKVNAAGLNDFLVIDSAGTHNYRIGAEPDAMAQSVAAIHGYDMTDLRARQITRADMARFDYVLPMDMKNMTSLHKLGEPDLWQKPRLLLSYSRLHNAKQIDDPYGAGAEQFQLVFEMIDSATSGLLNAVRLEIKKRGLDV
jgi:protein-tyrosine phosphatase